MQSTCMPLVITTARYARAVTLTSQFNSKSTAGVRGDVLPRRLAHLNLNGNINNNNPPTTHDAMEPRYLQIYTDMCVEGLLKIQELVHVCWQALIRVGMLNGLVWAETGTSKNVISLDHSQKTDSQIAFIKLGNSYEPNLKNRSIESKSVKHTFSLNEHGLSSNCQKFCNLIIRFYRINFKIFKKYLF